MDAGRRPQWLIKDMAASYSDYNFFGSPEPPLGLSASQFDENKPLPSKPGKKAKVKDAAKKPRRGLFKGKLEREVYENLYSELPMQTIMLEDIAPSTSVANGDHSGQRMRREPRVVKEHFDHRVLVKYNIKALIGKGSFSRVVQAEERGSGGSYAMKLVTAKDGRGPFENELAILQRLHHPNLIRLHEVIRSSSRVYLVMDLATGGELYERIVQKGKFSEAETASTIRQLLEGLAYLHRLGITHRDLKPENLLYTKDPQVDPEARILITDFGLAFQQTGPEQRMSETCGTPEYIAPEVLMRTPYTEKIDLWSTGVIAYILLSGIMPFDSESRTRLYRQIIRGKYHFYPEFFARVTSEALGFVACLLETEPEVRLSAEDALLHPWIRSHSRPKGRGSVLRTLSLKGRRSPGRLSPPEPQGLFFNHLSPTRASPNHHSPPHLHQQQGRHSPSVASHHSPRLSPPMPPQSLGPPPPPAPLVLDAATRRASRGRSSKSPSPRAEKVDKAAPIERTRSSRSIRSVARSDHTHRVKPQEVERLWEDPELRRIVFDSARTKARKANASHRNGYTSDSHPRPTIISVNAEDTPHRRSTSTQRSVGRRALGPSASDNFCIVGVTESLPRPGHKATKDYGLL